jgi:putative flippase GtrA
MMLPSLVDRLVHRSVQTWHARGITLKAASFGAIGVLNTLVDLGVFLTAYRFFKLPLVPANVLAWLVAVSGSFVMNSFITFAAESGRRLAWRSYGAFVASGIAGVIANTATLVLASFWIPVLAAKLLAIAASFVVNFSLSHFVVFRQRSAAVDAEAVCRIIAECKPDGGEIPRDHVSRTLAAKGRPQQR